MEPRIEILKAKKLIGQKLTMSLIDNKTGQLWSSFAPRIKDINNRVTSDKISM
jgi:AraC family transcriptional regulator